MLLNSRDDAGGFISERVDVKLSRLLKELVDQDGTFIREVDCCAHVFVESLFVINDGHGAAAEHVTGPHEHWIADSFGNQSRAFNRNCGAVLRLRNSEFIKERAEPFSIFREVD